jgi:hypothetical protein
VIDHELRHLMLAKNKKTGQIQLDDEGRPKLRIRPHDFEFGWFARTAELYGEESYEVSQAREIVAAQFVQDFLPGFEVDPDPTGLAAFHRKLDPVRAIGSSVKTDDTHKFQVVDDEDGDEETTAEFILRQRKKLASERRKKDVIASKDHDEFEASVNRQSTAALSAKATKPKRASKKGDTVAS